MRILCSISRPSRRGSTLAVTLWALVALVGLVLTLGHSVRVETVAVGNRTARVQADAAERGAEQWLLSVVETEVATPGSTSQVVMEQRMIGDCAVWVLTPDPEDPAKYTYGLTDEGGKIDLNTATSDMLLLLPGITQEVVDSITDWRDADSIVTGQGGEDEYYLNVGSHPQIPEAYGTKNSNFESIDELMLVKGVTTDILFGVDRNRNGVIDVDENDSSGPISSGSTLGSSTSTGRGIYPFVTAWGVMATASAATTGLVDVNSTNTTRLQTLLQKNVSSKAANILATTRRLRPFRNVFDWYFKVGLAQNEFSTIYTQITANPAAPVAAKTAKVNINTAAHEVLLCLPGLDDNDAQQIMAQRAQLLNTGANPADLSWLAGFLTRAKLAGGGGTPGIGSMITGSSKVFSGDIVAVSSSGRTFRRDRVVIDGRSVPAKIIYRRDKSSAGWPLPPDIRTKLREGMGLVTPLSAPLFISQRGTARS